MKTKPRLVHLDEKILSVKYSIYEERLNICNNCYANMDGNCSIQHVHVTQKVKLKASSCPQGFWTSNYDN